MRINDKKTSLYYLANILKGVLEDVQTNNLFETLADDFAGELFDVDLNALLEETLVSRDPGLKDVADEDGPGRHSRYGMNKILKKAGLKAVRAKRDVLRDRAAASRVAGSLPAGYPALRLADGIADSFGLDDLNRDILRLMVVKNDNRCVYSMFRALVSSEYHGRDFFHFQKDALGYGAMLARPVREIRGAFFQDSVLFQTGLLEFDPDDGEITASAPFLQMINSPQELRRGIRNVVLQKSPAAVLGPGDFAHAPDFGLVSDLLRNAMAARARGVNVLLYGKPGTGKTEMARTIAAALGADLYSVGEQDECEERNERLSRLLMAKRLVMNDDRTILLFDEAEDVFVPRAFERRSSKIFLNKLLENTRTPVVWITNNIRDMDSAYVRRFSHAVELDTPPQEVRTRMWATSLSKNKIAMDPAEIEKISRQYELPPAYMTSAVKVARLVKNPLAVRRTLDSLEYAVTGRKSFERPDGARPEYHEGLVNADADLGKLTGRIVRGGLRRFSLCLFGPPGTGKTEYVAHLAGRMGLRVLKKRVSDIMSMFVGETEANIAGAFEEARRDGKFLVFDEADSFLMDRAGAFRSWEVTQVNEMLAWMETHPQPFACTTNLRERLDPASLRRFTFKVGFGYLTDSQSELAFRHFFHCERRVGLSGLTPADFALAAKKADILGVTDPAELAALLADELKAKGLRAVRMGF
ncbi:MAG: ATP-binding protein [Deltaproteobacteria bacterium]|jgi:SpoVK/Ycf46/Vps4 family AAA+-type ATPase|nr:ATP-binding protein [Deltaproteobacteria bacterium]